MSPNGWVSIARSRNRSDLCYLESKGALSYNCLVKLRIKVSPCPCTDPFPVLLFHLTTKYHANQKLGWKFPYSWPKVMIDDPPFALIRPMARFGQNNSVDHAVVVVKSHYWLILVRIINALSVTEKGRVFGRFKLQTKTGVTARIMCPHQNVVWHFRE